MSEITTNKWGSIPKRRKICHYYRKTGHFFFSYLQFGIDDNNKSESCLFANHRLRNQNGELSRDPNTSVYANTAFGEYAITHEYSFMSGLTYQTSESTSYTHVSFNELEASSTGYAFEYTIPIDSHDEQYPYSSFVYTEIAGGLTYEGHVTQPSVTTSVNHWATYAHQKLSLLFNGINFSYPFSMGFSITFGFAYDQLIDEHLWLR